MALDDATTRLLQNGAEAGGPPLHEMNPQQMREMNDAMTPLFGDGPDIATVRDEELTAADGSTFPVRIFQPDDARGVIVYYHGGGWIIGSLSGFDTLCRLIADRTQHTVVLVEYRKAPEVRFPGAFDDAWTALEYADRHRADLASADAPLIVAGDSSGGNLAAAVAQRAAQEGAPTIAFQALVYPVTDADFTTESYEDPANALMLAKEAMVVFWDAYVPDPADRTDPRATPLNGSAQGAPPALVLLAEHDVLRSEGAAYAAKLRDAGVPVEEHVIPGQMHGFFTMPNVLPGSARAIDILADAVARV